MIGFDGFSRATRQEETGARGMSGIDTGAPSDCLKSTNYIITNLAHGFPGIRYNSQHHYVKSPSWPSRSSMRTCSTPSGHSGIGPSLFASGC